MQLRSTNHHPFQGEWENVFDTSTCVFDTNVLTREPSWIKPGSQPVGGCPCREHSRQRRRGSAPSNAMPPDFPLPNPSPRNTLGPAAPDCPRWLCFGQPVLERWGRLNVHGANQRDPPRPTSKHVQVTKSSKLWGTWKQGLWSPRPKGSGMVLWS